MDRQTIDTPEVKSSSPPRVLDGEIGAKPPAKPDVHFRLCRQTRRNCRNAECRHRTHRGGRDGQPPNS